MRTLSKINSTKTSRNGVTSRVVLLASIIGALCLCIVSELFRGQAARASGSRVPTSAPRVALTWTSDNSRDLPLRPQESSDCFSGLRETATFRSLAQLDPKTWRRIADCVPEERSQILTEVRRFAREGNDDLVVAFCDLFLIESLSDRLALLESSRGSARECYLVSLVMREEVERSPEWLGLLLCSRDLFSDSRIGSNCILSPDEYSMSLGKWAVREQLDCEIDEYSLVQVATAYCCKPGPALRLLLPALVGHPWIVEKIVKPRVLDENPECLTVSSIQELELYLELEDVTKLREISLHTDNPNVAMQCLRAAETITVGSDEWIIALAERFGGEMVKSCIIHLFYSGRDPSVPVWQMLFNTRQGEDGAVWLLTRDDGRSFSKRLRQLAVNVCMSSNEPLVRQVGMKHGIALQEAGGGR